MADMWGFLVLRNRLLEGEELFEDREFPPTLKSITHSDELERDFPVQEIIWKRPKDIVAKPSFVKDTATRSDLDQGLLGDCWFVAAASLLANGPKEQFERCVPQNQGFSANSYAGIFHFKFWDYGAWSDVIIDDLLPTDGKNLIFCQNRQEMDEFWGALLEKAYAKYKGLCYEAINGGKMGTALVDFTGGLSELIALTNPKVEISRTLFELLQKNSAMESFIGASIYEQENVFGRETRLPNGLYQGHAYSVTDLREIIWNDTVVRLLRIRNPHGENEWNGPWSDKSHEMKSVPKDVIEKLKVVSQDDGEFWMSYEDFLANFDELCLCHLLPDSVSKDPDSTKKNWRVSEYHDAWIDGLTAGGCGNPPYKDLYWKNPQFQVQLTDPDSTDRNQLCTLIVSLMEKEKLIEMNEVTIGFDIYEVRGRQGHPINGDILPKTALKCVARSGNYTGYREVVRRFEFEPGTYVVIPSTFYPSKEASFLLRLYTEMPIIAEVLDENNIPSKILGQESDPIFTMFKKHAGDDNRMDYKELQAFFEDATTEGLDSPISFTEETCRCLLVLMDKDKSGFLNMVEAQHAYKEIMAYVAVFKQFDLDKSNAVNIIELGAMFKKIGFPVSRNVLLTVMRRYGGRNRQISLEDFIVSVCKLSTMYLAFFERQRTVAGPDDVAVFTRNEFLEQTMFC